MSIFDRQALLGTLQPRPVRLEAGETLLREGEQTGAMYVLEAGELEVLCEVEDGEAVCIGTVSPGATVGEISLLRGTPHTATVRARAPCRLLEITREKLATLDAQGSTPLADLLREVAHSISAHLERATSTTVEALRREVALLQLRQAMASFLVVLLMGLASYAVLMKILSERGLIEAHSVVISAPILAVMAVIGIVWARRSGLPARTFGLTWEGASRHARQAVRWTLPVLGMLTVFKWGLCTWVPRFASEPVFPGLQAPLSVERVGPLLAYLVLVPIQEFVARGATQGPLFEFLPGSERRRWVIAIVVSNTLFGVTHLHLTFAYGGAAFLGGLLWGTLFARQRSLVGPILSHWLAGLFALDLLGLSRILEHVV